VTRTPSSSVSLPRGAEIEDPRRNLHFTLRNAPFHCATGMEMQEDAIVYSNQPLRRRTRRR